jgi:hypothetical protein
MGGRRPSQLTSPIELAVLPIELLDRAASLLVVPGS